MGRKDTGLLQEVRWHKKASLDRERRYRWGGAIAATTVFIFPLAVLKAMRVSPQSAEGQRAAVGGSNQSPCGAGVHRAQNAETEVGVAGVIRFPGGRENHSLCQISVAGLDGDRANRQRGLILGNRSPGHIVGRVVRRVGRLPAFAMRTANVNRIASRIGGIDGNSSRASRDLMVVLRSVARSIRGQGHGT